MWLLSQAVEFHKTRQVCVSPMYLAGFRLGISVGKTRKYIPEIRIRKPYRREPKLRVNVPLEIPFDFEDTEDECQEKIDDRDCDTQE